MYYFPNYNNTSQDRIGLVFPFLVGAVAGGAAIGLTRPRPIVNAYPANYTPYNPYMPYSNTTYSYYYPYYR